MSTQTISAKHTPGPWAVFHDHPDPTTAKSLGLIRPVTCTNYNDHGDVASVYVCELPERAANARLIAAAPELLAALQEIAGTVVYAPEGGHEEVADCVRIARAAIAKAIGEAA